MKWVIGNDQLTLATNDGRLTAVVRSDPEGWLWVISFDRKVEDTNVAYSLEAALERATGYFFLMLETHYNPK